MARLILALALMLALLPGCGRRAAPVDDKPDVQVEARPKPNDKPPGDDKKPEPPAVLLAKLPAVFVDVKQQQYDAALNDALDLLAERKLPEAMRALEAARGYDDNDFVRGEIARLKQRLEQAAAARATTQNIATVLADGAAAEASKLAGQALKELGGGDDAGPLVKLRVQADALAAVQDAEAAPARHARFRREGAAALADKNLRAAALAFEQALAAQADAGLAKQLAAVNADLQKYDALRAQAAALRKDSLRLEEALAVLQAAQATWDTLPVRQDLDEVTLALQKRRPTLGVADFTVRADLGVPDMGRDLADALLPLFKPRFDLVERAPLGQVAAELNLSGPPADAPAEVRALGRLARARFLVVGSVYPLAGITVQARIVDTQTGLVVQTARLVVATPQEALARAPELVQQLLLNDDEKKLYDATVMQQRARAPVVIAGDALLPQLPALRAAGKPRLAFSLDAVQLAPPPPLGGVGIGVFRNLAPLPPGGIAVPLPMVDAPGALRQQLLVAALRRGDFYARIGDFAAALGQYEIALTLAPGNPDVLARIDLVRPVTPPLLPVAVLPRVAVLPFLVTTNDPTIVPPGLGDWTPQQLAPYLSGNLTVIDPAIVYWTMGSLGLTVNDLATNPTARVWVGRALGARYFLFGAIEPTANFDVTTYLVDAEMGTLQGSARIRVQNVLELKLRLGELAQRTLMSAADQQAWLGQAQVFDALVYRGQLAMQQQDYDRAVLRFTEALQLRPDAIEVQYFLIQAQQAVRFQALDRQRRQYLAAQPALFIDALRRQRALAQATEQARAAAASAPRRPQLAQQRVQAQAALLQQAQAALKAGNFTAAANTYAGALAIAPPPADASNALAQAQAQASRQAQALQVQTDPQKQHAQALAATRTVLTRQQARATAQQKARIEQDRLVYAKARADGEKLLNKGNYDAAAAAFVVAQRFDKTPAVSKLLDLAVERKTIAQGKTDAERGQLQEKLATERAARKAATAQAQAKQAAYRQALQGAEAAVVQKDYSAAQAKFEEAGAIFQTDAVLAGLKQVARARQAPDQPAQVQPERDAEFDKLLGAGKEALAAKRYADAVTAFARAAALRPKDQASRELLGQAQSLAKQAEASSATNARLEALLKTARAALKARDLVAASKAIGAAKQLEPVSPAVQQALRDLDDARAADADRQKKLTSYQAALAVGQKALAGRKYAAAIQSFTAAAELLPDEPQAPRLLKQAQQAQADAERRQQEVLAQQKQERENKIQAAQLVKDGTAKLLAKQYPEARGLFQQAIKLNPKDVNAVLGLRQANQALEAGKVNASAKDPFQKALQNALAQEKQQNYAGAVKHYEEALQLMPKDQQAAAGLRRAQLGLHVADGQRLLDQMRFRDAVQSFEAALKLAPGNPAITKLLERAKQMKK